jgi:hypothetical protein
MSSVAAAPEGPPLTAETGAEVDVDAVVIVAPDLPASVVDGVRPSNDAGEDVDAETIPEVLADDVGSPKPSTGVDSN